MTKASWKNYLNEIYSRLFIKQKNSFTKYWLFRSKIKNFYRTISASEIDFIVQKSFDKLIPIEVKYRHKVYIPESIKNFSKNYKDKVWNSIIFSKDILDKKDNTYIIPSSLIWFIDL